MALFNYTSREINAKIVYYGPGLSGKTTNIKSIYEKISPEKKGKLITLPTYTDRTLFFDFFPLEAGEIKGYKMRFHLYTVPGQVFYNATRKLVLKGADGVVFVADSQDGMMDSNLESLYNLKKNLADHGINMDDFPVVLQYNKRDLPGVLPIDVLDKTLNNRGVPYFSASASTGEGVLETLTAVSKLVLGDLREMIETGRPRKRLPVP
ncbi:MAG: ADP-ribosylation factor-like protein, partial [Nitrospirota bacterium]